MLPLCLPPSDTLTYLTYGVKDTLFEEIQKSLDKVFNN